MKAFTRKLAAHFQDQLEGKGGEYVVSRILKGTDRMHSLIKKLLDYARVGTEGKSSRRSNVRRRSPPPAPT